MTERNMSGIAESDLVMPSLRLAASKPGGEITTSDLIVELTDLFNPTGKDEEIIPGRKDTYFSQKVRNLISHRQGDGSFIENGYAEYTGNGLRVTDAGKKLLKSLGGR
jgi:hypothetical protein